MRSSKQSSSCEMRARGRRSLPGADRWTGRSLPHTWSWAPPEAYDDGETTKTAHYAQTVQSVQKQSKAKFIGLSCFLLSRANDGSVSTHRDRVQPPARRAVVSPQRTFRCGGYNRFPPPILRETKEERRRGAHRHRTQTGRDRPIQIYGAISSHAIRQHDARRMRSCQPGRSRRRRRLTKPNHVGSNESSKRRVSYAA
jgi:hypothetical protein